MTGYLASSDSSPMHTLNIVIFLLNILTVSVDVNTVSKISSEPVHKTHWSDLKVIIDWLTLGVNQFNTKIFNYSNQYSVTFTAIELKFNVTEASSHHHVVHLYTKTPHKSVHNKAPDLSFKLCIERWWDNMYSLKDCYAFIVFLCFSFSYVYIYFSITSVLVPPLHSHPNTFSSFFLLLLQFFHAETQN